LIKVLPELSLLSHLHIRGLHGKMPTKRRQGTFKEFEARQSGMLTSSIIGAQLYLSPHQRIFGFWSIGVLLCTDLVARGIDIPNVDWIIQYVLVHIIAVSFEMIHSFNMNG
jgi:superfamily II DNA/RNA helicase